MAVSYFYLRAYKPCFAQEMKKSGKYNDLQAQVNAIANTLTRLNTQYELKTGAIDEELANLKSLSGTIETVRSNSALALNLYNAYM